MTEEQKKEEETGYVDRYNEKAIRNRRKFPGGYEAENGFDMNGNEIIDFTNQEVYEFDLFN